MANEPKNLQFQDDYFWKLAVLCGHTSLTEDLTVEIKFKNFEPGWLRNCDDSVIKKFASAPDLKKKIGDRMRADYLKGELDTQLVEKYIKFFV